MSAPPFLHFIVALYTGTGENNRLLKDVAGSNIALLQIIRKQDFKIDSITADFFENGYNSVHYLYEKGCRNIGFVNGSMEKMPYKERYTGFQKAIKKLKLKEHIFSPISDKSAHFEEGYQATEKFIKEIKELDGIMVAQDLQGLGVIRCLKDHHLLIPETVKVISLTGNSIGAYLETPLTSMEVPSFELGRHATKMIVDLIEMIDGKSSRLQHVIFQSELIERKTS